MPFPPGTMIADYRLVKKLGEGGMGEVYMAVHKLLGNQVVLKCLHKQLLGNDEMRARFVREAEAMALLSHPNILKIFNLLDIPEGVFIVMELVEGEDFDGLLNRMGPLPVDRAIEITLPVLSALAFAHQKKVIHRDIKPANLMLLTDGEVRVLDFGIAKMETRPGLTRVGMTLGTATYMPPEQHLGMELTPATDLYAIGVTLYELITGRLPFEAEDTGQFILAVMRDPPVAPRLYKPDLPEKLDKILLKCLEKKPENRYASAEALEKDLRAVLADLRKAAPREDAPEVIDDEGPGHRLAAPRIPLGGSGSTLAGAGAGAGVVAAAAGAWLIHTGQGAAGAALVAGGAGAWAATTALLSRALARYQEIVAAHAVGAASAGAAAPAGPGAGAAAGGAGAAGAGAPHLRAPAAPTVPASSVAAPGAPAPQGHRTMPGVPVFAEPYRVTTSRRAIEPWRHTSFEPAAVDEALRDLPAEALPRGATVVAAVPGPAGARADAAGPPSGGGGKPTAVVERFGDKKTVVFDRE